MRPNSRFAVVAACVGVAWIFLVTFSYYIVHKPFSLENAVALANVATDLCVAAILFALGAALGNRVLADVEFSSRLEALVFETGIGLGLVSFLTLALGLAGFANRVVFWLITVILCLLLRRNFLSVWRDLRTVSWPLIDHADRLLAIFTISSLLIGLAFALTPPIAWDAQTYHLVQAKMALGQGRITAPADIVYLCFPSLVEMLFLAAMLLKSDIAGQLVHFGFLVLLSGTLLSFSQRYLKPRTGIIAVALVVSVPSLMLVATSAYVDVALAFYAFGSLYALLLGRDSGDRRWVMVSGALAGMAMGCKYTSAIIPIALVLIMLLNRPTRDWRLVSLFVIMAGLVAAPWYLRNLAFTGNPVYPFIFGGPDWDAFRTYWFSRFGTGLAADPLKLLAAPWDATIMGREGGLGYEATIGPLLLAVGPLLVLTLPFGRGADNRPSVLRELLVVAGLLYLFWLVGIAGSSLLLQTRLLFPAFPLFALLVAIALERLVLLDLKQFSLARFSRAVMLLVVGVTLLNYAIAFASSGDLSYLTGGESRDTFLARNLGTYGSLVRFVNTQLPATARVLMWWEPRSYYFQRSVQPDAILDGFPHLRWKYGNADVIAAYLRAAGYTHIVLNRAGLNHLLRNGTDPISAADLETLQQLVLRHVNVIYGNPELEISSLDGKPAVVSADTDDYAVYEIRGTGAH